MTEDKNKLRKPFYYRYFDTNSSHSLRLTQYGYHRYDSIKKANLTAKTSYIFHIVLKGTGYYRTQGKIFEVHQKQMFLLRPAERVEYGTYKNDYWTYMWIGLDGKSVENFLEEIGFGRDSYVIDLKDTKKIEKIIWKMIDHNSDMVDYFLMSNLYSIMDELLSSLQYTNKNETDISQDICNQAIQYIKNNLNQNIRIFEMCKELGVERSTLFKKFKKKFNCSPTKYIDDYKMNVAENMITQTMVSFKTIAVECGYETYTGFYKMFLKTYGVSPYKYRNMLKNKS